MNQGKLTPAGQDYAWRRIATYVAGNASTVFSGSVSRPIAMSRNRWS